MPFFMFLPISPYLFSPPIFSVYKLVTEGDVRLVNGQSSKKGRVEVCSNEIYGTAQCVSDLWGVSE